VATDVVRPDAAPVTTPHSGFRPDVEGLRAVAIATVVAYHFQLPPFTGGFVGVDVFFVVSGFVITRMLLRERDESGRTSLTRFYARRARRILPAATVVLTVTTVATYVLLGSATGNATAHDAIAAALFYANVHFAHTGHNYLTLSVPPSPLVHFWSLSIEEQFYFVWPGLLALVAIAARRHRAAVLAVVLGAVWIASTTYSVTLTSTNGTAAFYSSLGRAGELALGGLVAVTAPRLAAVPRAVAGVLSWAGLVAIVTSAIVIGTSHWPGAEVLWPTVATAVVIAMGEASPGWSARAALGSRPFVWLGALSYSLYLWHWPIYALTTQRLGHVPAWWWRVALLALAVVVAVASYRLLEQPVRQSRYLTRRPGASLLVGALCVATSLVVATASLAAVPHEANLVAPPPAPTAAALSGALSTAASVSSLGRPIVPLSNLPRDFPSVEFDRGCLVSFSASTAIGGRPSDCAFGDRASPRTLVLFGDSNADMWLAAFDELGRVDHFKVELLARASCQLPDLHLWNPALHAPGTACTEFRAWAIGEIHRLHPFAAVLADYEYGLRWDYSDNLVPEGVAAAGLTRTIRLVAASGADTFFMGMAPAVFSDPGQCLHVNSSNVAACASPTACLTSPGRASPACAFDPASGRTWASVERLPSTVARGGGRLVDVTSLFCTVRGCPPVVSRIVVNYDLRHVTMHYTRYVALVLGAILEADGARLTG
jgi:peptidoglycan/LPS O-acetylase OafA/YrhL